MKRCCFVICGLSTLLGCGDAPSPAPKPAPVVATQETTSATDVKPTDPAASDATATAAAKDAANADAPKVTIASWKQVEERVGQLKGKVVVLDLWSTSCLPCVREFPNLVALQKQFGDKVVCMSFSLDYTGDPKEPAEKLLPDIVAFAKKHNAQIENFLSADPDVDVYDKLKLAAIPAVMVFDREGKLAKRFDNEKGEFGNEFTYKDHVVPFVTKLVGE